MKPVVKTSILTGSIFGFVFGITIAISIDFMMGSAAEGGWYESVRHDISLFLSDEWAEKRWFIYSGIIFVIGGIGVIGGIIGAFFGAITGKFFDFMSRS